MATVKTPEDYLDENVLTCDRQRAVEEHINELRNDRICKRRETAGGPIREWIQSDMPLLVGVWVRLTDRLGNDQIGRVQAVGTQEGKNLGYYRILLPDVETETPDGRKEPTYAKVQSKDVVILGANYFLGTIQKIPGLPVIGKVA